VCMFYNYKNLYSLLIFQIKEKSIWNDLHIVTYVNSFLLF